VKPSPAQRDSWSSPPRCPGSRTLLSGRLRRLVELAVFEKVPLSETSLYYEYVLTEMGQRLFPVVTALRQWGADYLFDESEPRPCLVDRRTPPLSRWWQCSPLMDSRSCRQTHGS
jgi:HxlR-like helix-turn-helix protein